MAQVPNRLTPGLRTEDAYALINDNFDKTAQNVADLGAANTTTTTFSINVSASGTGFAKVGICNPGKVYPLGKTINTPSNINGVSAIAPRVDMYVDNDNNASYLYPLGSAFAPASYYYLIGVSNDLSGNSNPDVLATFIITLINRDVSAHNFFFHVYANFFSSGASGVFR